MDRHPNSTQLGTRSHSGDRHRRRRFDLKAIDGVVVRARFSYGVSRVPV